MKFFEVEMFASVKLNLKEKRFALRSRNGRESRNSELPILLFSERKISSWPQFFLILVTITSDNKISQK